MNTTTVAGYLLTRLRPGRRPHRLRRAGRLQPAAAGRGQRGHPTMAWADTATEQGAGYADPAAAVVGRGGFPAPRRPGDRRPWHRVLRRGRVDPAGQRPAFGPADVGVAWLGAAGHARRNAHHAGPPRDHDHRRRRRPAGRGRTRHPARPGPRPGHHRGEQRLHYRTRHRQPVRRPPRHPGLGVDGTGLRNGRGRLLREHARGQRRAVGRRACSSRPGYRRPRLDQGRAPGRGTCRRCCGT
jgi:hypothetical protein